MGSCWSRTSLHTKQPCSIRSGHSWFSITLALPPSLILPPHTSISGSVSWHVVHPASFNPSGWHSMLFVFSFSMLQLCLAVTLHTEGVSATTPALLQDNCSLTKVLDVFWGTPHVEPGKTHSVWGQGLGVRPYGWGDKLLSQLEHHSILCNYPCLFVCLFLYSVDSSLFLGLL